MRYIVSGGGTGGHIYPAVAILEEIRNRDEDASFLYVGKKGSLEERVARDLDVDFAPIRVQGLARKLNPQLIRGSVELLIGLGQSAKIVRDFKPDCVIGTGGFVTGPILLMAALMGKKTLIHEQNSLPGLTNRLLGPRVDVICLTYQQSAHYFQKAKNIVVTGNPVRQSFQNLEAQPAMYDNYSLNPDEPIVFIFGGSNGSVEINQAVRQMIDLAEDLPFQIILATGPDHYEAFIQEVDLDKFPGKISVSPYLDDIGSAYAICDLVICSSGAISLAEISSQGLASILIPKAYTAENHQEYNARLYQEEGASDMILESDLDGQVLYTKIMNILSNDEALALMGENARSLANPKASSDIVDQVEKLVKGGKNV